MLSTSPDLGRISQTARNATIAALRRTAVPASREAREGAGPVAAATVPRGG
jgi:hypothetical protein